MKQQYYSLILLHFLLLFSCKKAVKTEIKEYDSLSTIKYAKGFDIIDDGATKTLLIKSPYRNAKREFAYTIHKSTSPNTAKNAIKVPINKVIVTSTTHIPMLELLQKETTIVGFPHTKYISSEKTRELIARGAIKDIGKEHSLNTEILIDLHPDLVVGFSVNSINKAYTTIERSGIKTIMNGDWLEETPLGRAEWIKFFGVLFDEQKRADSIFNVIEKNYTKAKSIAKNAVRKPSILSGAIMNKDIWNLPAGNSFVAQYLKDANTNYLWSDTKGKGSLSLSFETILDKGKNADYWISPGYFSSTKQLLASNQHYGEFNAFKTNNIYTSNLKKGASGGILYFELGPTRPDLVLKDIIKIAHPNLLPEYNFTFFQKIK
ncbi:ABC transporter substrate-binding protein [Tenacibaculum maritimum]|uniref:ABC transporter substrate-binding protein n=1 Tax=Tenacibaculum maritimum TaxID=107401 RepID=UPI0012E4964E|nr:ABC transporter substrate-binding protein [Tenacibaculum maritimum]CAA0257166.1 ABC-type iron(III)-transport system, binding lipoprotein precursor component [Tenacibaculum maritimum]